MSYELPNPMEGFAGRLLAGEVGAWGDPAAWMHLLDLDLRTMVAYGGHVALVRIVAGDAVANKMLQPVFVGVRYGRAPEMRWVREAVARLELARAEGLVVLGDEAEAARDQIVRLVSADKEATA